MTEWEVTVSGRIKRLVSESEDNCYITEWRDTRNERVKRLWLKHEENCPVKEWGDIFSNSEKICLEIAWEDNFTFNETVRRDGKL